MNYKLHRASKEGHFNIVYEFIRNGANLTSFDTQGYTPLHYATKEGHVDIAELILSRTKDANVSTILSRNSPLILAIRNINNKPIVRKKLFYLLIQHGANIHHKNNAGETVLHWAALNGDLDIVKILLTNGADPYAQRTDGATPFLNACQSGCFKTFQQFSKYYHDYDIKDFDGFTPLHFAMFGGGIDIIKDILSSGADPNVPDVDGYRPVNYAWRAGYPKTKSYAQILQIYHTLLDDPTVDFDVSDPHGRTPLHYAARFGDVSLVKRMLDDGVNEHAVTNYGSTPFSVASPKIKLYLIFRNYCVGLRKRTRINYFRVLRGLGDFNYVVDYGSVGVDSVVLKKRIDFGYKIPKVVFKNHFAPTVVSDVFSWIVDSGRFNPDVFKELIGYI